MTPEANGRLSAAAQATAAKALMLFSARVLSNFLPSIDASHLRDQTIALISTELAKLREEMSRMTFPEMTPVESDMWTQEALEAFDSLSQQFLRKMLQGP